jgi:catechol 2,3-dioxygenase-like lactoylglutathione lyase family enzyme
MAARADAFYRDVLGAKIIRRFDRDTDEDMEMQREDVDVLIELKGVEYRVSEKFREHDYEDLYIEIYSKYPDTPGWVITGTPNATGFPKESFTGPIDTLINEALSDGTDGLSNAIAMYVSISFS